ncbi:MAG TPA: hypothetical protein VM118_14510 [Acidobacteriota bacterium]|nr:hypothetical protein [Acidobacteriota bacterium]
MMRRLLPLLACLCLVASAHAAGDISREFPVSPGGRLDIDLRSGGSLDINGWDRDVVSIEVMFRDCDPDDYTFDFDATKSGVRVRSEMERRVNRSNISMRIRVPDRFDLKLRTAGGGISISDVEGTFRGSTAGGSIELERLTGDIDLSTGGGTVTVTDSHLDGEVTTGGGKVLVENVDGDFDANSGGGEVVFKNVSTPIRDYPKDQVHIRNAGGEIKVNDAPGGADVSTGGGNVRIRSANEFAIASTGGGDITINAVDGWVKATTGAGDVEVTMIGDPDKGRRDVSLLTGMGDVTLTVPRDLEMDIEVEIAYSKGKENKYRIVSDFDLEETRTRTWDRSHGTPLKYIYGEARIGDGRNRITIRTSHGNVYLKKGR